MTLSTLRGEMPVNRFETAPMLRNWRANQGAQVIQADGRFDGRVTPDHHQWFPARLELDAASRADLDPLFDELVRGGRRVYWVIPPISRAAGERRRAEMIDRQLDGLIAGQVARHGAITVVDGRGLVLADAEFRDPFHLNASGSAIFSGYLAEAMARAHAPGGWIDLAKLDPPPAPVVGRRVETLAESRRIVTERLRR